jgi:hypothetical protein
MRDETAQQFFDNLHLPANWVFCKTADYENSIGRVYYLKENVFVRVYFFTPAGRGGMVENNTKTGVIKNLIDNKTSEQINEFLKTNYT